MTIDRQPASAEDIIAVGDHQHYIWYNVSHICFGEFVDGGPLIPSPLFNLTLQAAIELHTGIPNE
ncbi:MAG: hypothetical protein GY906_24480 [bacterium]|nr:hypothetical protein [bacterium]